MSEAVNLDAVQEYEHKKEEAKAKGERVPDDEVVRAIVPFEKCIESFLGEVKVITLYVTIIVIIKCIVLKVEQWRSPVTNESTFAKNTARLLTSPDYLLIQLKKFDLDEHWVPYKLDVEVTMPDELDISVLRKASPGLQPGEEEMPDTDSVRPTK
jgi:ubiquitin C-terminal hydrolase